MQLFLEVVFQLSVFAVNILLPLSLALVIVGCAVAKKSILKSAFFSGIAVVVLYLVIFGVQLSQVSSAGTPIADIFKDPQGLLSLGLTILLPIIIGLVVVVMSNRQFKKIA